MIRLHKTNNLIYSVGFLPLTLDSIRTVGEDKSQSLKKISRKRFSCVSCLARFFPIYKFRTLSTTFVRSATATGKKLFLI